MSLRDLLGFSARGLRGHRLRTGLASSAWRSASPRW